MDAESLFEQCRRAQLEGSSSLSCVDYLVASTEYHSFMALMHDFFMMDEWQQDIAGDWVPEDSGEEAPGAEAAEPDALAGYASTDEAEAGADAARDCGK